MCFGGKMSKYRRDKNNGKYFQVIPKERKGK
jgi:hypothetical protein